MYKAHKYRSLAVYSDHWATPQDVFEDLNAEFSFDYDPCPLSKEVKILADNGLVALWTGRIVFCNPPYSQIPKWLNKAKEARVAVYLLPARTDTKWFHEICLPFATEIRFVKGRLRFGRAVYNAPFPSMVVVFINDSDKAGA